MDSSITIRWQICYARSQTVLTHSESNMEKLALVTGVSRETGLGLQTARQLSAVGFNVIITVRSLQNSAQLASDRNFILKQLDISDDESVGALAKSVDQEFGKLDVLINNAGAYFDQGGNSLESDMNFIKEAFDTNLLGAWRMITAFAPLLKKSSHGRIVNVSSGAGSFSDPDFGMAVHRSKVPVYALTKLALNGLTVKLAVDLADTKIKINSVCPGFVATYPGTDAWGARPVAEGAKGIVWAATLPDNGPNGKFFRDGKEIPW